MIRQGHAAFAPDHSFAKTAGISKPIARAKAEESYHVAQLARGFQGHSKLAAAQYPVKSEGMFPYETYYVLATDQEVEQLYN